MIRPSVECWAVRREGDNLRVLLLHAPERPGRHPALWQPVSGGVEAGETPLQACLRELREETGLSVSPHAPVEVAAGIALVVSPEMTLLKTVYAAVVPGGPVVEDPEEHDGHEWLPPGRVHDRLWRASHRATWALAAPVATALAA
jgi:8-oxo-dGTP pyrophosphatase MutT (NUDIX family)